MNDAPYRIEVFTRRTLRGKQHYFRIRSNINGLIVAQSEGYSNRLDCTWIAGQLVTNLYRAPIVGVAK